MFPKPTTGSLSGRYLGRYNDGVETITLLPNGKFSQIFIQKGKTIYKHAGTWSWQDDRIDFTNGFWCAADPMFGPGLHVSYVDGFEAAYDPTANEIIFNDDLDIWATKVKQH